MKTVIFTTDNFPIQEFTSAWTYLSDISGQPCFGEIEFQNKEVICETSEHTIALNALVEIIGFGKVMLQTDKHEVSNQRVNLLESLINGRIKQIESELLKTPNSSLTIFTERLQKIKDRSNSIQKLASLLHLGENLVLSNASSSLATRITREETKEFLIGCQSFGIDKSDKFKKIHEAHFDLGVAPFYFSFLKPDARNKSNWELTDRIVNWLGQSDRQIKGHPLVWFHIAAKPAWMEGMSFEEIKSFVTEHVTEVVSRYRDRIKMWDIINEVPVRDANSFDFTVEQLLELTKLVSELVKKLQPDAERIINFSDMFGSKSYVREKPCIPPIHFLKLCFERGIEFESIGLQFYMGMRKELVCRELLNISQTVDQFVQLGKPIHFSELGWPSQHDVDIESFFATDHPEVAGRWHSDWSEQLQAEFAENIYTLFASKPKARSITWWDLTDNGKHVDIGSRFIPFGGLTRRDFSEKPILLFIRNFRKKIVEAKSSMR